jgi:hypothetical protein
MPIRKKACMSGLFWHVRKIDSSASTAALAYFHLRANLDE